MSKQFYTNSRLHVPLLLLLPGAVCKVNAQTLNCSKSVANITTTGDGTTAIAGRACMCWKCRAPGEDYYSKKC